ncbi:MULTISPECIES: hypothetical protein [unclassified Thiocapsa]|uniref:hypothetical protein n=1 Tax=unclassified Thiocapsa TaxID=2641286 RepID=UPI0035B19D3D
MRNLLQCSAGVALCCISLYACPQDLIAHRGAGVERLTRNEARLFFTMRLKNWPNGTLVKVFVLPDDNALHSRFSNGVLGLYPYQLRRVWDRQIFSGTGQAPTTVSSEQEMLDRIATTPGAIGYADGPIENPSIRQLEVR